MITARGQIGIWGPVAFFFVALILLQIHLGQSTGVRQKLAQFMYLPNGEYLRIASLGYREVMADLLWIQAIQVMGERKVSEEAGRWLYRAFDVITTLDPKFVRAYEAGSLALTTIVVLPEESNQLLEKGIRRNPDEWRLPFIMGINYYFEFYDDEKAAESIAAAARLPDAPAGLVPLAANLFMSAKSPQQAVELLAAAYQNTTDESAKRLLEIRLKIMITERDLQLLEQAIDRYEKQRGHRPGRLGDLVGGGVLRELPVEPSGGRYLYDPRSGVVSSSELAERPRLEGRRRAR